MNRDVTVCIPSIPPRVAYLHRAVQSVINQTQPIAAVSIAFDVDRQGAGPTRNRAKAGVRTTWTAYLDDDDELRPGHVKRLLDLAEETGADVLIPWFTVQGGGDPFPMHRGRQFDPADPHIFPITVLVRTEVAQLADFPAPRWGEADWHGDDFPYWNELASKGATFAAIPEETWIWHHHSSNTSGIPSRW